jgi:hypothetical protein
MSILGVLIDKTTVSRVGDALGGVTYSSYSHSLPATNPEMVLPIMRSVEPSMDCNGLPIFMGLGGNASLMTVGYACASCVSCPTIMFDVVAMVFHSVIR